MPSTPGPDLRPIPFERLEAGIEYGWLRLLTDAMHPTDRVTVECRCKTRLTPMAGHLATGNLRYCGSYDAHGRLS